MSSDPDDPHSNDSQSIDVASIISKCTLAIDKNPTDAEALSDRADAYKKDGEYEKAIVDYTKALASDGDNDYLLQERGNAYQEIGEHEKAITDFTRALIQDSDDIYVLQCRAECYCEVGNYSAAIADLSRTIALDETDAYDFSLRAFARAKVAQKTRDFTPAIKDYTQAIARDPNSAEHYLGRAAAHFHSGDSANATTDYIHALELDPSDEVTKRNLRSSKCSVLTQSDRKLKTALMNKRAQFPPLRLANAVMERATKWLSRWSRSLRR